MEGRGFVLIIDEPEADLFAVHDLVVVILPEEDHRRLPGKELREDLAVALLVLGAVAAAGLPRQAAFADEHALRREPRLGRQLGVDVIEGGADFFGG